MVTIKGYEIPNLPSELTVEQFDKINAITKNNLLDNIEKEMEKLIYLGVPSEVFEDMSFDEFKDVVLLWNDIPPVSKERVFKVEIDGHEYVAPENVPVKDIGLIEKAWKTNTDSFSAETLAILFKRSDLSRVEHYAPAHIKHKTKIFKQQKAELAMPHVYELLSIITKSTKKISDDTTKELEGNNG